MAAMQQRPEKGTAPRKQTLRSAREEARRIADEAWAWHALHVCLKRVLQATIRGLML